MGKFKHSKFVTIWMLALVFITNGSAFAKDIVVAAVEVSQRGFWGEDGTAQGSSVEITNTVAQAANIQVKNVIMPYPRILHNLEVGKVDLALLVPNDKVTKVAIPLVHLQNVDFIIVGKRGTELNNVEDLTGKRVGYLRSSRISEKILENLDVINVEGDQYTHMIQMLMHDRIDAMVAAKYTFNYSLKELGYTWNDLSAPFL
ncbi:transporter substrate-binding domain-containing protein [Vibrio hannami]|uniref:substrate-binding periplasmic protein n=1 Tax=Vibrio hannami TaxID=2717094 RepID=UPI00240F174C|nr:transporter substrate-binding domain-containing protein [Vibrio hannami]MDG3087896.1 transporter substrate-binding domain-containing protein [Vibrio hannami]